MVDEFVNRLTVNTNVGAGNIAPVPNLVSGTEGLNQLVNTLDGFIASEHDRLDKETVRKAKRAGAAAGLQDDFKTVDETTLAAEAYNRAGSEIFINKKITNVGTQINTLENDPSLVSSPVELGEALEDLQEKELQNVPLELIPDFQVRFNVRSQQAIQNAQNKQFSERLQAARGEAEATEQYLIIEATNSAKEGNEEASKFYQQELLNLYERSGPLGEGGSGSFTPEEIVGKKLFVQQQMIKSHMIGELERASPEARPALMEALIKENPLRKVATPEEQADFLRDVVSAYQAKGQAEDAAEEELIQIQRQEVEDAFVDFAKEPNINTYTDYISKPGIKGDEIKAARIYLFEEPKRSNQAVTDTLDYKLANGSATYEDLRDPIVVSSLTRDQRTQYFNDISDLQTGREAIGTEEYKYTTKVLEEDFSTGRFSVLTGQELTPEGRLVRNQLRSEVLRQQKLFREGSQEEPPAPLEIYTSLKAKTSKAQSDNPDKKNAGPVTVTTEEFGGVEIPKDYLDDPEKFQRDYRNGVTRFRGMREPEVLEYMAKERVKQLKEDQNGQ